MPGRRPPQQRLPIGRRGSPMPRSLRRNFCRSGKLWDGFRDGWNLVRGMNTSFNLRGEAIVNTPTDAIRPFFSPGTDYLVIGNFAVEK